MKRLLLFIFLSCIISCKTEDVFSPSVKYIYSPEWKVWDIILVESGQPGGNNVTRSRDFATRYIFTDSVVYYSINTSNSFLKFPTKHISLDSISFVRTDGDIPVTESYYVRNLYITGDAYPPEDSLRKVRDGLFPEIIGNLLFLQLENKKKTVVENKVMTEYLFLYN
jgi:hypothetical protein